MLDDQPAYRFRWKNCDLDCWIDGRLAGAKNLRRDAAMMMARAEAIEQECHQLKADLIEVTPEEPA